MLFNALLSTLYGIFVSSECRCRITAAVGLLMHLKIIYSYFRPIRMLITKSQCPRLRWLRFDQQGKTRITDSAFVHQAKYSRAPPSNILLRLTTLYPLKHMTLIVLEIAIGSENGYAHYVRHFARPMRHSSPAISNETIFRPYSMRLVIVLAAINPGSVYRNLSRYITSIRATTST